MRKLLESIDKFAGEPEQKRGDQVRGTDNPKKSGKKHGFHGRLVGEDMDSFTQELLNDIADAVADEFHNYGTDIIEDYELEMNYREVELSSVDFDGNKIKRAITEALSEYMEEEGD